MDTGIKKEAPRNPSDITEEELPLTKTVKLFLKVIEAHLQIMSTAALPVQSGIQVASGNGDQPMMTSLLPVPPTLQSMAAGAPTTATMAAGLAALPLPMAATPTPAARPSVALHLPTTSQTAHHRLGTAATAPCLLPW